MPDFYENSIKSCARLERKKVAKARCAEKNFREIIALNVEGGGGGGFPPGLIRVKGP